MIHLKSFKLFTEALELSNTKYFLSSSSNFEDIEDEFLKFRDMGCLDYIKPIKYGIYKHIIKVNLDFPGSDIWINRILKSNKLELKPLDIWVKEEFLDKMVIKTSKDYPNFKSLYCIGDYVYLGLEKPHLWCDYYRFWYIFSVEFHMEYKEVQDFIKEVVEEHLKLKGVTPSSYFFAILHWVEEHLKLKVVNTLQI